MSTQPVTSILSGVAPRVQLFSQVEVITPDRAARDLAAMDALKSNFRARSKRRVDFLAKDMSLGRWDPNGETVKFNEAGLCVDGQHRLAACVLAGVPFTTLVAYNVKSDLNIDGGVQRKFSDYLASIGDKNTFALQGAIRLIWLYQNGALRDRFSQASPTFTDLLNTLNANPAARNAIDATYPVRKLIPPSPAAFAYFVTKGKHGDLADKFFSALASGEGLGKDDPILRLRDRLSDNRRAKAKLHRTEILALMIKAWNLWLAGRLSKTLAWRGVGPNPEAFPDFS